MGYGITMLTHIRPHIKGMLECAKTDSVLLTMERECIKAEIDAIYDVDMNCSSLSKGTIDFICKCKKYIKVIYTDDDTRLFYDNIYELRRNKWDADWEDIEEYIYEMTKCDEWKEDRDFILHTFKKLYDVSGYARRFVIG